MKKAFWIAAGLGALMILVLAATPPATAAAPTACQITDNLTVERVCSDYFLGKLLADPRSVNWDDDGDDDDDFRPF
jgi:hypothetical protein